MCSSWTVTAAGAANIHAAPGLIIKPSWPRADRLIAPKTWPGSSNGSDNALWIISHPTR